MGSSSAAGTAQPLTASHPPLVPPVAPPLQQQPTSSAVTSSSKTVVSSSFEVGSASLGTAPADNTRSIATASARRIALSLFTLSNSHVRHVEPKKRRDRPLATSACTTSNGSPLPWYGFAKDLLPGPRLPRANAPDQERSGA
eukprot:6046464-Prymnesium_polylepis.2